MSEIIFHIDVNSAYLSWTSVENLRTGEGIDLRNIPSIIGGDEKSRRGVVLAKSVPAKKFGIVTGEPIASALKKCPTLVIARPDHALYHEYSHRLMDLLYTYTSDLEQISVDECFLLFTPIAHRFSSYLTAAYEIKNRIHQELGFTVNIGIAPNKLLAKMASDFEKPDKVHTLFPPYELKTKMWPLPVGELYMVGLSSASRLLELGIRTIGELANTDPQFLISHFKSHGRQMWEYANGIDPRPVISEKTQAKGIGNSTTLPKDVSDRKEARKILLSLSDSVSRRLRKAKLLAGNICVEIKYHDFTSSSHQGILSTPDNTTDAIYTQACTLFDELWNHEPIRLLGIRSAKLVDEGTPTQMSIFDYTPQPSLKTEPQKPFRSQPQPNPRKQKQLEDALDVIRKRYGKDAVQRGTHLKKKNFESTM